MNTAALLTASIDEPQPHSPIRVLIADDHPLYAEAATLALANEPGIEIIGKAADGKEALTMAATMGPDVVLMDLDMPILDGIEATLRMRLASPGTKVIVVTASASEEDERRAMSAGAVGYFRKGCCANDLADAIREVRS